MPRKYKNLTTIRCTKDQYLRLKNGETVNGHTYNKSKYNYLVEPEDLIANDASFVELTAGMTGVVNKDYTTLSDGQYSATTTYQQTIVPIGTTASSFWNSSSGAQMDVSFKFSEAKTPTVLQLHLGTGYPVPTCEVYYLNESTLTLLETVSVGVGSKISKNINSNKVSSTVWVIRFKPSSWMNLLSINLFDFQSGLFSGAVLDLLNDKADKSQLANKADKTLATTTAPGLMSADDKSTVDVLKNMLTEDSGSDVVDTIHEVLSAFDQFPEQTLIVDELASKANKVKVGDTEYSASNGVISLPAYPTVPTNYVRKDANTTLNQNVTTTWDTYGTRKITISGNAITLDMSGDTGGWAGNFATFKDAIGTTNMLGFYGGGANGLVHFYMGGTYNDPSFKITKTGLATFKNRLTVTSGLGKGSYTYDLPDKSGTIALTNDIPTKVSELTNDSNFTSNTGTVTSVSAGTGLSISGTATVNPTVNVASGYKLPTTNEWNLAYSKPIIMLEENGSTTAGTWLAKTDLISSLEEGQLFLYKIAVAGASNTYLNVTCSGTASGNKQIYRVGTTKLTTHYAVGTYILLYYNGTHFVCINDYDANSYAYVRQYQHGDNAAGTTHHFPILTRYNVTNKYNSYDTAYTRYHTDTYIDTSNGYLYAPKLYSNNKEVLTTSKIIEFYTDDGPIEIPETAKKIRVVLPLHLYLGGDGATGVKLYYRMSNITTATFTDIQSNTTGRETTYTTYKEFEIFKDSSNYIVKVIEHDNETPYTKINTYKIYHGSNYITEIYVDPNYDVNTYADDVCPILVEITY